MLWRTDAFQAAGLDPPGAHWTLIEFHQACTALEGLAASGRLPGLKSALGPIVSSPAPRYPPAPGNNGLDALSSPGLWQAFAWGFGGPIATADGFRLTDAATVAGMQALVDLIREFAPVQPAPPGW